MSPDAPRRVLGVRVIALVEIGVFFAVALGIDAWLMQGDRFWYVEPHPFWLIVVLIAVQYGSGSGLVAAVAASAALLAGNLPAPVLGEDVFDYWTNVGLRPVLWIGAGQILGQLRDRQLGERERLYRRIDDLDRQSRVISESFEELKQAKSRLESRIARQFRTVVTTYRAAQSIDVTEPRKLFEGIHRLVEAVLFPRKYSTWKLGPEGFELDQAVGWTDADDFDRTLGLNHPIVQHLLARQPALCVARADDERILAGQGLLAGALADADTGEIVGMLKIEDAAFLDFNLYTLENFNVICSWLGSALVRARRWQALQSNRVTGMNAFLMTEEVFERISDLLRNLGDRKGFESSQLSVSSRPDLDFTPEQHSLLALAVGEAAQSTFRATDLAFEREREDTGFAILLPGTPVADGRKLASRLRTAIAERLPASMPADVVSVEASPLVSPAAAGRSAE